MSRNLSAGAKTEKKFPDSVPELFLLLSGLRPGITCIVPGRFCPGTAPDAPNSVPEFSPTLRRVPHLQLRALGSPTPSSRMFLLAPYPRILALGCLFQLLSSNSELSDGSCAPHLQLRALGAPLHVSSPAPTPEPAAARSSQLAMQPLQLRSLRARSRRVGHRKTITKRSSSWGLTTRSS